ncbi:alpha-N-acetylgalactosaminide alpha-2,6-sialyltransferase 2-like isoform X3 [Dendrobates tinctorius]|uniref:alpha-N-acetylgalactosaminide alpha-2,6-sialyltransferase 2-like isoform X3 n=1 Tax=Dendrobates tinctorius TaxID=92724 RepID=UPI003CCA0592
MMPYVNLRSKSLMKILLALCLVTMVGLLISRKEQLVNNLSPLWTAYYKSHVDLIENYIGAKEIEKRKERPEMTIQQSLQPEGTNTTSSPKPIENVRKSSTVTRKTTKATSKPLNESIKLQNKSAKSHVTTQRPNVTSKPQNVKTRKPIPKPTKKSSPSTTFNYLGDKYATDETHVHSKCPNRIRDKLRSKEFQNMFLEKIPVLQRKKHAQESEYERLKKYSGAQGWMGVTWEIINKTLNLLNSTGNAYMFDTWRGQSPCIRCAVVGNGGILNGSGMGQEIDSHDYVFRMNGAITKDFEKDVGNRTSFFSFSTNTLMNSLYAYGNSGFNAVPRTPETRYVVLPDHDRDYLIVLGALTNTIIDKGTDKGKDPAKYFGKNLTTEHFKILHPDFMRYLRNRSALMDS